LSHFVGADLELEDITLVALQRLRTT
jgi:hypothetical protein